MTRVGWRRVLQWLLVILLAWWLLGFVARWWSGRGPVQQAQASAQQRALGRYLLDAADCAACHTAEGGAPFAGGVPLRSPFGTIYGTNITPDPDHGIGRYTDDDFFHALTRGEARDGHQLYPAMPYVSYKSMTRADSDALYAYLMNQVAVKKANPSNDVRFPANIRAGMHGWNLLFADAAVTPVSRGNSPAWQRGRYLVETLGHCGECHSPRGALGQVDRDRPLAGNSELGRFAAPDITPQGLAARGWDGASLREYLATGSSAIAVASDEMLKVVNLSTSRLNAGDLDAMTIYLLGDAPPAPVTPASVEASADAGSHRHYFDLCAGCHGRDGGGVPNVAVSLRANTSVRDPSPHNLIVAVLDGLPEHDFPGLARMQDMPGFAADLDDTQVAALVTWLRQEFGGQSALVEAASVRELRR
ncbi:MAG TPA: cytochrome c [Steroidobacteraceae bacterium]|nr:cytochrome c [Steroidobacteraceae bacterium]